MPDTYTRTATSLRRKFFVGSFYNVVSSSVSRIILFASSLVMARVLGPTKLGIYGVYLTAASGMLGFTLLGIPHALHRYVSREWSLNPDAASEFITAGFLLGLIAHLLGAAVLFVLSTSIAVYFFHDHSVAIWIKVASAQLFLAGMVNTLGSIIHGFQEFKRYAFLSTLVSLFNLVFTIALVARWSLTGAILTSLLCLGFSVYLYAFLIFRLLRERCVFWSTKNFLLRIKQISGFGIPIALGNVLSMPVALFSQGLLSQVAGFSELGYLRVGTIPYNLVSMLPLAISSVGISVLAEASPEKNQGEFNKLVILNARLIWIITLPLVVLFSMGMEHFVVLFFGESFRPAAVIGVVTVWTGLLVSLYGIIYQVWQALGRVWWMSVFTFLNPLLFFFVARWMIHPFRGLGYVLSEFISYILVFYIQFFILRKEVIRGELTQLGKLFNLTVFLLVAVVLSYACIKNAIARLLLGSISFVGVSIFLYFSQLSKDEKRKLRDMVMSRE